MPQIKLKIIGHVPLKSFQKKIQKLTFGHPGIYLNISSRPLPSSLLLQGLNAADIILLPYKDLDSIRSKIPTKLYESLALHKPVLISNNPLWQDLIRPYPAGLCVDFSLPTEAKNHLFQLKSLGLYEKIPGEEVMWKSEKFKLFALIQKLLG